ncbi:protocadherin gamma-A6-like isoform X5 [Anguilla anguilla]|uniref:protocadherin gamma-A6-like isoform X5 n=1 Tax=Anguilla anguilla TaxID=7936 RepID=UPI0015AF5DFE|nr:protocadherin gamma-A6-like isoform X5 [Anguilla anguilla]
MFSSGSRLKRDGRGQNAFSITRTVRFFPNQLFLVLCLVEIVFGQIRYSIPEESKKGSFVGNIAQDLGTDPKRMKSGSARIVSSDSSEYIELHLDKGILVVRERIDREQLCGQTTPCSLSFEMIMSNPMQLHSVVVEILDVNDNAPRFTENEIKLEIFESALPGSRILQESATDPDVGINALQSYTLNPTSHFSIKIQTSPDGSKYVEMFLHTPLDREKEDSLVLTLTAVDGGEPQRSGTVRIIILVLDFNDNIPVFTQSVYKAEVIENAHKGTLVTAVSAADADDGLYGHVTYHFARISSEIAELFSIDQNNGAITVMGHIDYEKNKQYELNIQAKDQGGLMDSAKVIIEVIDVNDNAPMLAVTSFSSPISEDSVSGTTVAIVNVKDPDSGMNGQIDCSINTNVPFTIKSTLKNYYTLLTEGALDRERNGEYNITFTAVDKGTPPLSSNKTITLKISDVNDNAPVFEHSSYAAHVMENNVPGLSVFSVRARDSDWNQNARISYFLVESVVGGIPVSSFISVNSESGAIHAVRSFDYEQIKGFQFRVKAQDGGSPPLSSNVTVAVIIQDQNDNAPQILYPVQTAVSAEIVPPSAEVGFIVTKVVAVDVDSGQNAWLSYKLLKATDRALFEVGSQNGEIRTLRQVTDKDAVKQRLTVVVEDNGRPSLSATVNVNVALADRFPEVLSEFTDFTQDRNYNDNLTFYLVMALAVVSFLFISSLVVIISVKIYRWRQSRIFYQSNLPVIPYYPPRYADSVGSAGTLQHVYNYEVCRTTDSRKSDCKFMRPCSQSVLSVDPSGAETMQRVQKETNILDEPDSPLQQKPPNTDWRFSQNQRPGTSGQHKYNTTQIRWTPYGKARAAPPPEAAVGTGPWPNPPTEAEQLQALMAAANEVSEATATLGPGTMGLSTRYSPQFTLQHVPDYRQNVYIPGSTATLTANQQQQQQQQQQPPQPALPQPPPQAEAPKAAQTPASKKKSAKKDKK